MSGITHGAAYRSGPRVVGNPNRVRDDVLTDGSLDEVECDWSSRVRGGQLGIAIGVAAWLGTGIGTAGASTSGDGSAAFETIALVVVSFVVANAVLLASILFGWVRSSSIRHVLVVLSVASMFSCRTLGHIADFESRVDGLEGASRIVDLDVTWMTSPTRRVRSNGRDSWIATVRIDGPDSEPLHGCVIRVRIDRPGGLESPGVRCSVRGRITCSGDARNPGVHLPSDVLRRVALSIPHPGLVRLRGDVEQTGSILRAIPTYMAMVWRSRVHALSEAADGGDGMIPRLLLGEWSPDERPWMVAARRSGISHLFAISGLHMGLVAGGVVMAFGRHRRFSTLMATLMVLVFASGVVSSPSVSRATTTTVIATACVLLGWRARGESVVAVASAILLWMDPTLLDRVGFHLSVMATVSLFVVAPKIRRDCFGRRRVLGDSVLDVWIDRSRELAAASIAAWTVTVPMASCWFGAITPASIPATIIVAPMFMLTMALSMVSACIVTIVPSMASLVGVVVGLVTTCMVGLVEAMGEGSPMLFTGTRRDWSWMGLTASVGIVTLWHRGRRGWLRFIGSLGLMVAPVVMGWLLATSARSMTAIDVGDGTAIVLQDGDVATLYDVGSLHQTDVGRRTVVPVLRSIGVRSIDSIIVSHPNVDHHSGLIDVVSLMPVGEVVITSHFLDVARGPDPGDAGDLVSRLIEMGIPIREVGRGDRWRNEHWCFHVLHPDRTDRPRWINDGSIVLLARDVDPFGDGRSILLCGDVQRWGMATVMDREPPVSVDVMEVPHHGSRDPMLDAFVEHFDPEVLVQSTGPRRYRRGRAASWWRGRIRWVTCRDGAVWIDASR